jgi:hypothetical protein
LAQAAAMFSIDLAAAEQAFEEITMNILRTLFTSTAVLFSTGRLASYN